MKPRNLDKLQLFYEEHRQGLFSYALSITRNRDAAEDSIQEESETLLLEGNVEIAQKPLILRADVAKLTPHNIFKIEVTKGGTIQILGKTKELATMNASWAKKMNLKHKIVYISADKAAPFRVISSLLETLNKLGVGGISMRTHR